MSLFIHVSHHGGTSLIPWHSRHFSRQELKSHGELTSTMMKTKELAQGVQGAVEQDFKLHYRVADTQQFLHRLFPVEATTVNAILQSLKEDKL